MARVYKQVLGEFRGKIGPVVAKIREGKQYFASLPSSYRMCKEPHEVDKRNRFKVNGQFARTIRRNDLLYRVWDEADVKANNAYNKICKVNFKLCETMRPSVKNMITPPGFLLPVIKIEAFPNRIEIDLEPFTLLPNEEKIVLMLYVSFYEPLVKENVYYELSRISNYEQEGMKFIFKYGGRDEMLAKGYLNKTIFLAAVTENDARNIVRWSSTIGKDIFVELK
jgi:hypothetical protein